MYSERTNHTTESSCQDLIVKRKKQMLWSLCLQVKQLYNGALRTLCGLQLGWSVLPEDKCKSLERQVEQERSRRKVLGAQLNQLLDSQLQILRAELQPQREMHKTFTAALREASWLLALYSDNQASPWDETVQPRYV